MHCCSYLLERHQDIIGGNDYLPVEPAPDAADYGHGVDAAEVENYSFVNSH